MNTYKEKIAYLISLLAQIKDYSISELEELIELEKVEKLLDTPEISDRNWEKESLGYQKSFSTFLNVHIEIYEKILAQLKAKFKK